MAQVKAKIPAVAEIRKLLDRVRHLNVFVTEVDLEAQMKSGAKDRELTVALKDNFCTKGVRTSCGSRMLDTFVPAYDCTVWQRLKAAGAVLVGKTNLDEFAMGSGTCDSFYGATKNPWNAGEKWHIAGGSSGGSAVAVATGVTSIGIGSDTGGSTRNPASYCGVIGFKPTYGTVSRHGLIPLVNSMDVPGIFARTIDMTALTYKIIGGRDVMDSTTVEKFPQINPKPTIKGLKVGIPKEYYSPGLSTEIYREWSKLADKLEANGAHVQTVSLPHTADSIYVYSILNQCEVASNMARYDGLRFGYRAKTDTSTEELFAATREHAFNGVVKSRILAGNFFLLRRNYEKYFEKALKVRRLIANDFRAVFMDVDVLLTPTTLTTAPSYEDFTLANNRDQCAQQDYCTQPANMAGIPAISLPVALSEEGLPIGLQLMAPMFGDSTLLNVSKWIEDEVEFCRNYEKVEN